MSSMSSSLSSSVGYLLHCLEKQVFRYSGMQYADLYLNTWSNLDWFLPLKILQHKVSEELQRL